MMIVMLVVVMMLVMVIIVIVGFLVSTYDLIKSYHNYLMNQYTLNNIHTK